MSIVIEMTIRWPLNKRLHQRKKNAQVVGLVAKQLKEINHIYEKYRFKITDVSQQEGQLIEAVVETDHQTRRKVANSGEGYNCNADDLSDRKDLRDVVMSRPKLQNVSIVKNETVFEITCFRSKDMDRKKNWVLVYL